MQLKQRLKDAKLAELGYVESQISTVQDKIESCERQLKSITYPESVVPFSKVQDRYESILYLKRKIEDLREELKNLLQEREKIVEELVQIQKEAKVLEKLKYRKLAEFRKEFLKKEIKQLDEFASRGGKND